MGLGLHFATGEGPKFERPVRTAADIRKLPVPDVSEALGYVFDAVRTIRRELDGAVPLIGFSGSPWTVGTYMVEGGIEPRLLEDQGAREGRSQRRSRICSEKSRR